MNGSHLRQFTIEAIERGDFDVGAFDHEAHVYAGWCFLQRYPTGEAIERFSAALQRVTRRLGVPDKYHATITWFYLLLINDRRCDGEDWAAFRLRNADLIERGVDLLLDWYTPERLHSAAARRRFVLPDRLVGKAA